MVRERQSWRQGPAPRSGASRWYSQDTAEPAPADSAEANSRTATEPPDQNSQGKIRSGQRCLGSVRQAEAGTAVETDPVPAERCKQCLSANTADSRFGRRHTRAQ